MRNRYLGTVLAAACGDALGSTLEFTVKHSNQEDYLRDLVGGGAFRWNAGEWTDDTHMAVAVAGGILDNSRNPVDKIGARFLKWYRSGPKDIGFTCVSAIRNAAAGIPWSQSGVRSESAAGNGALMRTYPLALAYRLDHNQMIEKTLNVARMTHVHPMVDATCAMLCHLIATALEGGSPVGFLYKPVLPGFNFKTQEAWNKTASTLLAVSSVPRLMVRNTGYTLDTLAAAFWAFTHTKTLEDCIIEAANLGGDADSIATVAGALAGAYYGVEAIPERWLAKLMGRNLLTDYADLLLELSNDKWLACSKI